MSFAPVADQRIVAGAPAALEVFFPDQDGEPVTPVGPVTVTASRGDGTPLVATTAATIDSETTGRATYSLDAAHTARLDLLTLTWTDTASGNVQTTLVDIAGRVYFSADEARKAVSSLVTNEYSTPRIVATRQLIETEFERVCGIAFVPRYRKARIETWTPYRAILPDPRIRAIRSITTDRGITLDDEQLATFKSVGESRIIEATTIPLPWSPALTVEYEHGFDRAPRDIKDAAFTRLGEMINEDISGIPARATSYGAQDMTFRLNTADVDGPANPDIRAVLARFAFGEMLVA